MSILVSPEPVSRTPGAVPLPLPAVGWGAVDGLAALEAARPRLPAVATDVQLVSAVSTVVLRAGADAVKVYPPGTDAVRIERLRTALAGVPSVIGWRAAPVETAYGVVTLMPWAVVDGAITWPALGALLRSFHDEAAGLDVPPWTPLSRLPGQVADLAPADAAVLLGARAELLAALDGIRSELGVGVLHGDVSLDNALWTTHGPRLIDPDWVARGPLEYDLASAARRFTRGEIDRTSYRGFCAAYGHDVRGWDGLPLLDRIADLGALAFRLWDCRRRGLSLDWCAEELRAWRTTV
ncbi:MAG: phosphotransferase enzyme family protein [Marmoricola sp.]